MTGQVSATFELDPQDTYRQVYDQAYAREVTRLERAAAQRSKVSADAARQELDKVEREVRRRRWLRDPAAWAAERAGTFLWSKQREILEALRVHRKVAVRSCHGSGKSFIAAHAVGWFVDTRRLGDAAVVTTAPSDSQVKAILWKEIRQLHSKARLPGRVNLKEWWLVPEGGDLEKMVAQGRKPNDYDASAFQGIHEQAVLVVYDEACGIPGASDIVPQSLWEAGESLLVNEECRELAIGNPDDPSTYFEKICRPGSGWHVVDVCAFDTPNFTGEYVPPRVAKALVGRVWVEEYRAAYAPDWTWTEDGKRCVPPTDKREDEANPIWVSKILGKFPVITGAQGLIPVQWIEAAQKRALDAVEPVELGVDVGNGGDSSTVAVRRGPVVRVVHEDHNPDTMQTCGKVVSLMRENRATLVKVDKIGVGAGIYDRGKELDLPFEGVCVGEAALDAERFANLRAELWWAVRERFERGDVDLDEADARTASELAEMRFKRTSGGQILIESKDEAKRRGVKSPNRADAVMLAFAPARVEEQRKHAGVLLRR
jgi:hypothetical protein